LSFVANARGGTSDFSLRDFQPTLEIGDLGAVFPLKECFQHLPRPDNDGSILAIDSGFLSLSRRPVA